MFRQLAKEKKTSRKKWSLSFSETDEQILFTRRLRPMKADFSYINAPLNAPHSLISTADETRPLLVLERLQHPHRPQGGAVEPQKARAVSSSRARRCVRRRSSRLSLSLSLPSRPPQREEGLARAVLSAARAWIAGRVTSASDLSAFYIYFSSGTCCVRACVRVDPVSTQPQCPPVCQH